MDGYFYIIQLAPDAYPQRVKLGFTNNPKKRLTVHRTAAPTARILGKWPCRREDEWHVMHALTNSIPCRHIAGEVYDCDDPESLCREADAQFPIWNLCGFPAKAPKATPHRPVSKDPPEMFREATSGLPLAALAEALGVSIHAVRQYRLPTTSTAHRRPREGWKKAVAKVAARQALIHAYLARCIAGDTWTPETVEDWKIQVRKCLKQCARLGVPTTPPKGAEEYAVTAE